MFGYFEGYKNRRDLNLPEIKWIEKYLNTKFKWTKKKWNFEIKFGLY